MGPEIEIRVEPATLRAGANACGDLRDSIRRRLSDVEPDTWAADSALPGWHTRLALRDLLEWWDDDLGKFRDRLTAIEDALHRCAVDYEHADHTSAAHFAEARRRW